MAIATDFPKASFLLNVTLTKWKDALGTCEAQLNLITALAEELTTQWGAEESELASLSEERVQSYKRRSDAIRAQLVCQLLFNSAHVQTIPQQIDQLQTNLTLASPRAPSDQPPAQYPNMFLDSIKTRAEQTCSKIDQTISLAWSAVYKSLEGNSVVSSLFPTLAPILRSDSNPTKSTAIYLALQPLLAEEASHPAHDLSQRMVEKWDVYNKSMTAFNQDLSTSLDRISREQENQSLKNHIVHLIVFSPCNQDILSEIKTVESALQSVLPFCTTVDTKDDSLDPHFVLADTKPNGEKPLTGLLGKIRKTRSNLDLYQARTDELLKAALQAVVPAANRNPLISMYDTAASWVTGAPSQFEIEQRSAWLHAFHELFAQK